MPKFVVYKDKNINRALKTISNIFSTIVIILTASFVSSAQTKDVKMVPSGRNAEKLVTVERLQETIEYLTDTTFGGRALGSKGATEAAFWIGRSFKNAGLMPISGKYVQSFQVGDLTGHNIMGFMPGTRSARNETYVIVCAHYDSYGVLGGKILPGADSNASGVVAMTNIMDMLKYMKELGRVYGSNIIFLATDGKEKNAAGAEAFVAKLNEGGFIDPINQKPIEARQIKNTVVLDILGATLEPIHKGRKDYLIMLGAAGDRYDLTSVNSRDDLSLDLGFDYYGSKWGTDMFRYKVGDQRVFTQNGMPCTLMTSGITRDTTNKPEDDWESLNYEVFRKRVILIFHWLTKIL